MKTESPSLDAPSQLQDAASMSLAFFSSQDIKSCLHIHLAVAPFEVPCHL